MWSIVVEHPIICLSEGEGCDPINQFNPATSLWQPHARTWISKAICRGRFCVQLFKARSVIFVDVFRIADCHCENYLQYPEYEINQLA